MKLSLYNSREVFTELKDEWNNLVQASVTDSIFVTLEWQSTWWSAYAPGELYVVACRDTDGTLIGIAPWYIHIYPEHGRYIQGIGCVDVTDYLDIIVHREHVDDVYSALAAFLVEHRADFDVLDLCNIPERSRTHSDFVNVLRSSGFEVVVEQQEVCPVIDLPETWEDYLMNLNKKQRHEIRRKVRRAEGRDYEIDWYIVDDRHDLNEAIEKFVRLMGLSDVNKTEFLKDENNSTFFKKMVPVIYDAGWLQMSFLMINGVESAAYLNFVYRDRLFVYNSGLDPEQGSLSPGIVLLAYNIQHAIDSKLKYFDFLRGDEVYKYRMGGIDTAVLQLKAILN